MSMEQEYPTQTRNPSQRPSRPAPQNTAGKGGRYLKEVPKKTNGNRKPNRKRRHKRKLNSRFVILLAAILVVLIAIVLVFRDEEEAPTIVGRWNMDGTTFYRFEENGTGALEVPIKDFEFTYVIEDNMLYIDFVDESGKDLAYTFELQEDTLFLTGGPGDVKQDYALSRVQ